MASVGQKVWNDDRPEVTDNNYPVKAMVSRGIYYTAATNSLFCKLNGPRELKTLQTLHKGGTVQIPDGRESPVWMQRHTDNNRIIFTLREPNKGMATYGDAPVKTAQFAEYKHCECNVRLVISPAFPVVGFESQENIKRVISDVVSVEKANIARWVSEEIDFDAFRTIFFGASRGLLYTQDGGMGIAQTGGAAGQFRAPLNTYCAGAAGLTARAWNAATHNANLATAISSIPAGAAGYFTLDTHNRISFLIDQLGIQPVKIGGTQYRAVAIVDEWNIMQLRQDSALATLWKDATLRSDKNLAIYSRSALVLDDILYIPTTQLRFFRPVVSGSNLTFGIGMDKDPRTEAVINAATSTVTPTVVLGAGALLRGHRPGELRFTTEIGKHEQGAEYSCRYHDGWRRADWFAQDGRQTMSNDSMFVVFNRGRDPMSNT